MRRLSERIAHSAKNRAAAMMYPASGILRHLNEPTRKERARSTALVKGIAHASQRSHAGMTSTGNQTPQRKIAEKKRLRYRLKESMSCTRAVTQSVSPDIRKPPATSGRGASSAKGDVAAPKAQSTRRIISESIAALVVAQKISANASDSTSTGVASIASKVD